MNRAKILIVEDCPQIRDALTNLLRGEYDILATENAEDALIMLAKEPVDLIVMDLGLPAMDGNKLCANLKAQEHTAKIPIIILSGRGEIEDKLVGFSLGADDFLQKPADIREIKARIQIQLRKRGASSKDDVLELGPFQINPSMQKITVLAEDKVLPTSPLEFKLFYYLLTHPGRIFTREQLLDQIWGSSRYVNDRSVDVTISKLRQKLEPYGSFIEAVRGVGYRLNKPENTKIKKVG